MLYQCFKRQLKTPTCFGSFVIHPQGVLNVLDWNYLWYFCVCSWCLAALFLDLWYVCLVCRTRHTSNFNQVHSTLPEDGSQRIQNVRVFNCLL